ncbi:Wzz/FepE/Etk N-terminal domain-containing protein [Marinobacter sp. OP 3.4]|uniref:Wzz/FepE/Etk N-terminal domain-containing protein n=1 Tax=Marinobacter sp. OP 3.4 TaxID=3076501 RepID=UPI002E1D4A48
MNDGQQRLRTDDEIDLRDIAWALIEGWRWILGTMVAVVLLAAIYVFAATPIYSTNIVFAPPTDGLRSLNSLPGIDYSREEVVGELSVRLSSYENFSRFLEASEEHRNRLVGALQNVEDEAQLPAVQYRLFTENLSVVKMGSGEDDDDPRRKLTLSFSDRIDGPDFANQYFHWTRETFTDTLVERAQRAIDQTVRRNQSRMEALLDAQKAQVEARIARMQEEDAIRLKQLRDELDAEIASVIASREERIRILQNAEAIASDMGIQRPTTPRDLSPRQGNAEVVYAEINAANSQDGLPLYFMGVDALKAERQVIENNLQQETKTPAIRQLEKQIAILQHNREIEALKARESNAPFSEEYNRLSEENTLLRANQVDKDEVDVTQVISWAYRPGSPDSPKKLLILALSVVLGGMLGIVVLMIARLIRSRS